MSTSSVPPAARALAGVLTAGVLAAVGAGFVAPERATASPNGEITAGRTLSSSVDARSAQRRLWFDWQRLGNGEYALANRVVASRFRMFASFAGADRVRGPGGYAEFIRQTRAPFTNLRFTTRVGPLIDGEFIVGRFVGTGVYRGGVPGATAPIGTAVSFSGTDVLRVRRGKVLHYWLHSDFASRLGVRDP